MLKKPYSLFFILLPDEVMCLYYKCSVKGEIVSCYTNTQAVMLLGNRETQSDTEKERIRTALLPLFLNLSLTELRLDSPHKALKYGNKALEIDSANTKALFRCGQVRRGFCLFVFSKPSDKDS